MSGWGSFYIDDKDEDMDKDEEYYTTQIMNAVKSYVNYRIAKRDSSYELDIKIKRLRGS